MMQLLDTQPTRRPCAIPLLIELCAGTAALSLRLERAGTRPVVSRIGAKFGYADFILALAGLKAGAKAEHYVLCEPDEGMRLLLHACRDADLARKAASIIKAWASEEPRALWHRLKSEGPPRCPGVDPREVARWAYVAQASYRRGQPESGYDDEVARGRKHAALVCGPSLATRGDLPATIHDDATTLDPREVARLTLLGAWSYRQGQPESGPATPATCNQKSADSVANRMDGASGLPATILDDATTAPIPDALPAGTVVYIDPPYVGTTGYAHDLDRPAVIRLAQQWAAAGARVMISEAVSIEALVACGWHAVEISAMRVGRKRTFSKQQREWVTMNFQPDRQAMRALELATEQSERAPTTMIGGEQRSLFGVP